MRERLAALGVPCPRNALVASVAEVEAFRRRSVARASSRPPAAGTTARGSGSSRPPPRLRRCLRVRGQRDPRRGAGRLPARAVRAGGPLAVGPGGRLAGRRLDPARRHLPRGDRPGARTSTRPWRSEAQQHRDDGRGRARRHGRARRRAVRDRRRPGAGQRARDAAAQHRPLDPGRRGHQPVREPPARGARPAAGRAARARAVDGDGQHPRWGPTAPVTSTTATPTRSPATRGCGCTSTARSCGRAQGRARQRLRRRPRGLPRTRPACGSMVRGRPGTRASDAR